MNVYELADILSDMYDNALADEKTAMVHLFGIRYANIIRENNISIPEILKWTKLNNGSNISKNYSPEINKGIKLAKYVIEKNK